MGQKGKSIIHEKTRSETHEIRGLDFVLFRVISWMMLFRWF